jgi:putative heme-binding domain-containing protein
MKIKVTPEELVESILDPSKLIAKDYAQVSVLTVDGTVQTGIRVSENDQQIVLQNLAAPEPIKIAQDDIEDVIESKVSLMPANLVRQFKSREEFDDLMKYILEIRKR